MTYELLLAVVVPLGFVALVCWLNYFETERLRYVLLALLWGAFAVELSYQVNHPIRLVLGPEFTSIHVGPVVEEIFKSLVVVFLVRRGKTTFFVDGAIYGFAAGIGFTIAENLLYISRVDLSTGIVVATLRAFLGSAGHGSETAIVGMAIAGLPLGKLGSHPLVAWVTGLAMSMVLHTLVNETAFHHFVLGTTNVLVIAAINFTTLALVVGIMLWGLRRAKAALPGWMRLSGMPESEVVLASKIDDLAIALRPVKARLGSGARDKAAAVVLAAARLAMKQAQIRANTDPEMDKPLGNEADRLVRELEAARTAAGAEVTSSLDALARLPAQSSHGA